MVIELSNKMSLKDKILTVNAIYQVHGGLPYVIDYLHPLKDFLTKESSHQTKLPGDYLVESLNEKIIDKVEELSSLLIEEKKGRGGSPLGEGFIQRAYQAMSRTKILIISNVPEKEESKKSIFQKIIQAEYINMDFDEIKEEVSKLIESSVFEEASSIEEYEQKQKEIYEKQNSERSRKLGENIIEGDEVEF